MTMADTSINGVTVPFLPVGGAEGLKEKPGLRLPGEGSFDKVLQKELNQLTFSKHAQQRLETRHIELSDHDMSTLEQAVDRAAQKGGRDSLILLRDLAFIVNVPNRTVVTAMDGERLSENVFTNIDSAVIAS
jgi:flagellar operon protein